KIESTSLTSKVFLWPPKPLSLIYGLPNRQLTGRRLHPTFAAPFSHKTPPAARSNGLGFVAMCHSYYHVPFFVPFIHISVSLDNLFQRIASVYDCSKMALFDYLFHSDKTFGARPWHSTIN